MEKLRLNIDGKEVLALPGQTILEVARENDIDIPTFCYDERTTIYGACGLCIVEVEGNPKLCKSCATLVSDGMVIKTNTERVRESRKTNLELLLSNHVGDCKAPCSLACPAGTDCQGYVGLVANGEHVKANQLIKDKIPLPASIGRVCPHPCEDACRRGLIDEPISIAMIKRFAGEYDLCQDESFIPEIADETGKTIAIIGGGPMGLSAAYFLRQKGHDVTIFDSMPKLGGMMRYGIPEYRLPKEVLDAEIDIIETMGVHIVPNTTVGKDVDFETIRSDYDAVILGIGAWKSTGVGCPGEDAEGVIGGIDFLRKVVRNQHIDFGKRVAIVGGGNTAMDACRTAVRLGAEKVYNIYRRTVDEMPADQIEIEEAMEEGVEFKNLTNPIEFVKDENGHVKAAILQCMELGEPDQSGRRRPVAIEGKTETLEVDTVILAIGQAVNGEGFDGLDRSRKGGFAYDKETFMTSMDGVFAGGDCGNDKISIAIEAIADAGKLSKIVDAYLDGETVKYRKPYFVERHDITEKTFEDREKLFREKCDVLSPEERKDNFSEIVYNGLLEDMAQREADRCLQCGCHDFYECKLVRYANQYDVHPDRIAGEINKTEMADDHPFIARDSNKCILCGLCLRVCDEVMGVGALGLVKRGFDTVVKPNMEKSLAESGCDSCGQCVAVCPVGALQERMTIPKETPVDSDHTQTTCSFCSVGCTLDLESYGDMLIKANPDKAGWVNKGLCCGKGKFGFDTFLLEGKEADPMVRVGSELLKTDYHEAFVMTAKKMEAVKVRNGANSIAVAISDRYTNEEAYTIKKMARVMGAKVLSFNMRENPLMKVFGRDASPNTIDELLSTEVIVAVSFMKYSNPVIWNKIKQAAEKGVKVVVLSTDKADSSYPFAYKVVNIENDLGFLKKMAKALVGSSKTASGEGFEDFVKSLEDTTPCDEAAEVAKIYGDARKAMIVYQQNNISVEAAKMISNISLLSGHIGSPRDGILMVRPKNNTQGLADLGIHGSIETLEGIKGLCIFGEDPQEIKLDGLEFLMVSDVYLTDTAAKADVFIPATGFASTEGTYTNTERRLLPVGCAIDEEVEFSNFEIAEEIAHVYEEDLGFEDEADISKEMDDLLPLYKYAVVGEVLGGALEVQNPKFFQVGDGKLYAPLETTDYQMRLMNSRLPKVVNATASLED